MRQHRSQAGLTLLEMLVAVSMFALLVAGISSALQISLKASQKAQSHIERDRRVLGAERTIREQISALMPVRVVCRSATSGPLSPLPFFQGSRNSMRFVSAYSLAGAWRGLPHLLEYRVVENQVLAGENQASFRLILNELPWPLAPRTAPCHLASPTDASSIILFSPIVIGPASFVLADKLSRCNLLYRNDGAKSEWLDHWSARDGWPSAIRVDMEPFVRDQSHVELSAVTVPVRARIGI